MAIWNTAEIVSKLTTHSGLPSKNETVKTTQNSKNMTIFGFCSQLSNLMVYKMIKQINKPVLAYKEMD